MKKLLLGLMFVPMVSFASVWDLWGVLPANYFRPLNVQHPYTSIGSLIDVQHPGNSEFSTDLALVTHSPADGCLLPSVVCESWSPAMVGFNVNSGSAKVDFGPGLNVVPMVRSALFGAAHIPDPNEGSNLDIAIGPRWVVTPVDGGSLLPINRWRGAFRLFAGAALQF